MGIMDKAKQVGQLNDMRKQAQQMQKALESEVLEHTYAGGAIKIVIRGDQKIQSIVVDPDWLTNQSHDKVEFGLKDAVNQAMFEAQKMAMKKLQSMGGGLGLPGM
jgi:nucleoid-associated protein EbfC